MKLSDFCITQKPVPIAVMDKIYEFHFIPLLEVKRHTSLSVRPSAKSCYRPLRYEISKGRSGNSQHTFKGKGACDVTCDDFYINKDELLSALVKHTNYTRFAVYNNFIHCDYAMQGERWVFNSKWQRQYKVV